MSADEAAFPAKELGDGERALAGPLYFEEGEDAIAGGGADGRQGVRQGDDCARSGDGRGRDGEGLPDAEGCSRVDCGGDGQGVVGADPEPEVAGGEGPIRRGEQGVRFCERGGVGGEGSVLGDGPQAAIEVGRQGLQEQVRALVGEEGCEGAGGAVIGDGDGAGDDDGAGIEPFIHAHDGDAGGGIAGENGGGDGGCAPPAWEQGGVDVDAAVLWQRQHGGRQNLAVGGDDDEVRLERGQLLNGGGGAQARGLVDGDIAFQGQRFRGRGGEAASAPGGAIRLGVDGDEPVSIDEAAEGGQGEVGRAHEDDTHGPMVRRSAAEGQWPSGHAYASARWRRGGRRAEGADRVPVPR